MTSLTKNPNDKKSGSENLKNGEYDFIKLGNSVNANYFTIENYLRGIIFPSTKEELITYAEENLAPLIVINILKQFSEKYYDGPGDIFNEANKIE